MGLHVCHMNGLLINVLSGILSLLSDEIVLLCETINLLLSDLLLSILSLVVGLFSHAVQRVLHLLFLTADLFDSSELLIDKVLVPDLDLLLSLSFPISLDFLIGFGLGKFCLLVSLSLKNSIVILVLKRLQLASLFPGLLDLLNGSVLLIL